MGYKITGFMIGIVLVALFIGVAGLFLANLNENYSFSYDNESLEQYDQLTSITNTTEDIKESVDDIKEQSGILDIIGGFFSSAYNSLKLVTKSFTAFEGMADQAGEDINLGASGALIKNTLITITLIVIFIGIMIGVVVKVKEGDL